MEKYIENIKKSLVALYPGSNFTDDELELMARSLIRLYTISAKNGVHT